MLVSVQAALYLGRLFLLFTLLNIMHFSLKNKKNQSNSIDYNICIACVYVYILYTQNIHIDIHTVHTQYIHIMYKYHVI